MSKLKAQNSKLPKRWQIGQLIVILLLFVFPRKVLAAVSIVVTDFPQEIHILEEFEVDFSATGLDPNTLYYAKGRIGNNSSSLDKGQTFNANSQNPLWLNDSGDNWVDFPSFLTNSSGNLSGNLKVRIKSSATVGDGYLSIRITKGSGQSSFDSDSLSSQFSILAAPTSTLTPTPVVPASTSTPTPLVTNTPSVIFTLTPTPISYSSVYLNEYLPDPESGNEKVEIKNGNSFSVSLINWKIDDVENGGHSPISFSADISSSGFYTVDLGSDGFLNNDGDNVRLLDFNSVQKDRRDYSNSAKNLSWARDRNGNWCQQAPSFNSENSDCPVPTSTPLPTSTLAPTIAPTATIKPTATLKPTATPLITLVPEGTGMTQPEVSLVLGEEYQSQDESQDSDLFSAESSSAGKIKKDRRNYLFFIPIVLGLGFIGFSVYTLITGKRTLTKSETVE